MDAASGFLDAAKTVNDTDVYRVEPDPADFNHLLLSFHYYWHNGDTMGVFESSDGGDSWTIHDPIPGLHGAGGYGISFSTIRSSGSATVRPGCSAHRGRATTARATQEQRGPR